MPEDENTPEVIADSGDVVFKTVTEGGGNDSRLPDGIEEKTPEELTPQQLTQESAPPDGSDNIDSPFEEGGRGKKIAFIIGIVVIFIIVFVGIFSLLRKSSDTAKGEVTLVYWGLWEEKQIMEPLIAQYQKENPHVKIDYSMQSIHNYRQKLSTRGKEGRGPDIFRYHNTWTPMLADILAPIPSSIMSKKAFEETFYPVVSEDAKIGDSYVGIPLMIDCLVLLYNTNLFQRAGISSPPATWDSVLQYAEELTVPDGSGNILTSGIALGTASNIEHFSDILGWMLLQNRADIKKLTSNEASQVLASYRSFADPPNEVWSEHSMTDITAFVQEKVAMIIVPSWQILSIHAANPNIEIKSAPLPLLPGDSEPFSVATYWIEGVSKTSKHQIEAWKFLTYLAGKENMTKLYELQSNTRLFGEPYPRVDLSDILMQNEYIGAVIVQAPYLKTIPTMSRTFDDGLNDGIISYLENAVNETIQGASYAESMKRASEGIGSILSTYKIE